MLCFYQIWARLWVLAATSLTIAPRSTLPQKAARHEMQISHKTKCSQGTGAASIATVTTFARTWAGTGFGSSPSTRTHGLTCQPRIRVVTTWWESLCPSGRYSCRNSRLRRTKSPATFACYSSIMTQATAAASTTEKENVTACQTCLH